MRFCRRNEGTTSARSVFKKARDDTNASYRKLKYIIRLVLSGLVVDVLWGQPIKLIQVVSTSEFDEYQLNNVVFIFFCPLGFLQDLRSFKH